MWGVADAVCAVVGAGAVGVVVANGCGVSAVGAGIVCAFVHVLSFWNRWEIIFPIQNII